MLPKLNHQDQKLIDSLISQDMPHDIATAANLAAMFDMNELSPADTTAPSLADTVANHSIVEPFSTTNKYNAMERNIIGQAIEILASKLVDQDPASHFTATEDAKEFLQLKLATSEREVFAVIFLDNQHHVIAYEEMFIGTIDASAVYPREIIKRALELNAAALIVSHNHPTGILEASEADDRITKHLYAAAKLMHIKLLDHIIVSVVGSMSYAEHGMMPEL